MNYEELLIEADAQDLIVREKEIPGYDGRIYKNRIAIHKGLGTSTEKACVLAEELGHHHTSVGDILDQSSAANRKQELRARIWAYEKLISLQGIIECYKAGCRNLHEMADQLNVTEDFLQDALKIYRSKYGEGISYGNYFIAFEPALTVVELQQ